MKKTLQYFQNRWQEFVLCHNHSLSVHKLWVQSFVCLMWIKTIKTLQGVLLPQIAEVCCTGWQEEMGVESMVAQHRSASLPQLLNTASRKRIKGVASSPRAQMAVEV